MTLQASFVRSCLVGMGSAVALVAAACGSAVTPIGGDRDKVKETGGTGTGGGIPETGGSGAGGSSGGSPVRGNGGAAAGGNDVCSLPAESGNCDAYMERWAYDPSKARCEKFIYGGCGGNGNRFMTYAECMGQCDDRCAPQDAREVGSCEPLRGFKWDGQACVLVSGCDCQGTNCKGLSPTAEACESAHAVCTAGAQCGDAKKAVLDFIANHKACKVDADCTATQGGCTITETSCAGSVYVSTATVGAQFDELRQTLHDCLGSAMCDGPVCDIGIAPPACVDGTCGPGSFN